MAKNKQAAIFIAAGIALVLFLGGFALGRVIGGPVETGTIPSEEELAVLKAQIDEDEASYTHYEAFTQFPAMYRAAPDRIWFKPAEEENYYLFTPLDTEFAHILEVLEDRMHYSAIEDYNLYCFSHDSLETMATSGHRYAVLDYNNVGLDSSDEAYEYDLIFNFGENTRLYRLLRYLSYFKDPVTPEEEFTSYAGTDGYEYMQLRKPAAEYPKNENGIYWLSKDLGYKETATVESLSITTDGGETYQPAITKEEAVRIALEEAKKEKYKYQGSDCNFTESPQVTELLCGRPLYQWNEEWAAEDWEEHLYLWSVRILDENDPLCSLYLYIDAFTGEVIGGGQLSD